ncbi:translation protein SH3-like domain-containing protein [Lipomyces japonicus]|uniref:mitochondrial 54S ribosomal protein bL19m n=1 Tax=Lipomyces japonicus TaxID=56871 RepID=UPI0034CFB49F
MNSHFCRILRPLVWQNTCLASFRHEAVPSLLRLRVPQAAGFAQPAKEKKVRPKIPVSPPSLIPAGTNSMELYQSAQINELDPTGFRRKLFESSSKIGIRPGDVIKIKFKSEDSQSFEGTVIAIRRRALATTVRVRSDVAKLGVEMSVPVFSPKVESFELISRAVKRARRAKLYYLRRESKPTAASQISF